MRNRHLFLFMTVLLIALLAAGCGTRQLTKGETDQFSAIEAKIAKAEGMGAKECAPRELAIAKAELSGARHEASESWEAAQPYIGTAEKAAATVLAKTIPCWEAKQVKAAPAPPPAAPPPPPPAAPVPPPAPVVSLAANPASVVEGKCSTLTWSSSYATGATIDQGVGNVAPNGSRQVCPKATTPYTITATGAGGSRTAATTVTVTPRVIDRLTLHVNFDFDKSDIRKSDIAELEKAVAFVKKYPDSKVSVEGHTDSRGTDKYNLALSNRRAQAVKKYLVDKGERADRITAVGKGEAYPIADNKTDKGRFENRRVEVLIIGE